MTEEFVKRYGKYAHKIEIFGDTERGVRSTEPIHIGDILLRIPKEELWKGTHLELTKQLSEMDNEYSRSLPTDLTNFPVLWTPSQVNSLQGSAMKDMIPSRKNKLIEELGTDSPIMLRNRLLVGSRGFTLDEDTVLLVPYADMMNHANEPSVDWKFDGKEFIMRALKEVDPNTELFDTYGIKTNYEQLLFYGMTLEDSLENDVTYELIEIPVPFRQNLDYKYFQDTIEFELCGAYSRGTVEIFSLLRFLVCANAKRIDCPKTLLGLNCQPISRRNETMVAKLMYNTLLKTYNQKLLDLKDAKGKVADFAHTEIRVIMHWLTTLPLAVDILSMDNQHKALKKLNKLRGTNDYLYKVVRPLVRNKISYKK
tara:strand:- start:1250 stop:2353 length:1104 start_codon:yes stop_codon:yes gene_type:complete